MSRLGANPEQLDTTAQRLDKGANVYYHASSHLGSVLQRLAWQGPDADRFLATFDSRTRPQLHAAAACLREAASTLRAQAAAQHKTSEGSDVARSDLLGLMPVCTTIERTRSSLGGDPFVVRSESILVSSTVAVKFVAGKAITVPSEVLFNEMSDGTYRISIASSYDHELSLTVPIPIVSPSSNLVGGFGHVFEFSATTAEGAEAVREALEGRITSFTNRTVAGGGVDLHEVLGQGVLERSDVHYLSSTVILDGSIGMGGPYEIEKGMRLEVVMSPDGSQTIARTVVYDDAVISERGNFNNLSFWNHDSQREMMTYEVHDSPGQEQKLVVTHEITERADVRGGGEKSRDLLLSTFMADNPNSELKTIVTTNTYEFSMADIESVDGAAVLFDGAKDLSNSGDRVALGKLMWGNRELAVHERVEAMGTFDHSTRGLRGKVPFVEGLEIGASSTTGYGSTAVTERSVEGE